MFYIIDKITVGIVTAVATAWAIPMANATWGILEPVYNHYIRDHFIQNLGEEEEEQNKE